MFSYEELKKVLFHCDPEAAHGLAELGLAALGSLEWLGRLVRGKTACDDPILSQQVAGVFYPSPVGLAAGFDKNATMVRGLSDLGFGFLEVGTVTPRPQEGNPKPRLFRYPEAESIQNAMGFNNDGMAAVAARLEKIYPWRIPIWANIGKNKTTPANKAIDDYMVLMKRFAPLSDALVINISSPNTPGLRDLQNEAFIQELFEVARGVTSKPVFLKIAPDMSVDAALSLVQTAISAGAAGIIATNTTVDYGLLPGSRDFGGLSGKVLQNKSRALFNEIGRLWHSKTLLVSVGGIDSGEEAYRRIRAGANLVEIYSALIFKGPMLVANINKELAQLLHRDGFKSITEAVGCDWR
ncbi:MAG: quinone-dependent dihydroorotate dehydrogenase [Campylobacterales bacterium]